MEGENGAQDERLPPNRLAIAQGPVRAGPSFIPKPLYFRYNGRLMIPPQNQELARMNTEATTPDLNDMDEREAPETINEPRLWKDDGWTAKIVKNDDDEGWAVQMIRDGEPEPALVGPWTMGRDKKNPKPLDKPAFHTLVKTANEFIGRIEQQQRAKLHRDLVVGWAPDRIFVNLDIVPDDDFPYALLTAYDEAKNLLGKQQVRPDFKLNPESAQKWIDSEYTKAR